MQSNSSCNIKHTTFRFKIGPLARTTRQFAFLSFLLLILASWQSAVPTNCLGQMKEPYNITLKNGMTYSGRLASLPKMGVTAADVSSNTSDHGITMIDDDMREIFVSRFNVANKTPMDRREEEFVIWQLTHDGDGQGTEIGPMVSIGPLDEFGRRQVTIAETDGLTTVFQGITRINPRYVRFEGIINSLGPEMHFDSRHSIDSIPVDVLTRVLERQIKDQNDANERMRLVDFYVQAGKYSHAEKALLAIGRDFSGLKEDLKKRRDLLAARIARQALDEATLRNASGQPTIAMAMIKPLESSIDIADSVLMEAGNFKKELLSQLQNVQDAGKTTLDLIDRILAAEDTGPDLKAVCETFAAELKTELNPNNVVRLSTYLRQSDDPNQTDQQKFAIAISGWMMGAGAQTANIGEATSLPKTRNLVTEYLKDASHDRRIEIIEELKQLETGQPQFVDPIVNHILPPLAPAAEEIVRGKTLELQFELPISRGKQPETIRYLVQLPPEYDPYRRYPCILSLGGGTVNTTPSRQIDWWAGPYSEKYKIRTGRSARHGFIVIAPDWMRVGQSVYEYSAREHAVILKTLRESLRRFSIDTDRVFLSGHFTGATAAWDIGQAHPEHWTGVIPISGRAGKYINHYSDNVRNGSTWYFVNGARDFASKRANSTSWNARMRSKEFDSIMVHYHGRGTETFRDELPYLFQWMEPQRRTFARREFECSSMRPWDNYFWWFEMDLSSTPQMILPEENWNAVKGKSDWKITGEIKDVQANKFMLRGAPGDATLWLLPDLVDFSKDVIIDGQSGDFKGGVRPSTETLLEDVRTRADRQHPYWAKIVRRNKQWQVDE